MQIGNGKQTTGKSCSLGSIFHLALPYSHLQILHTYIRRGEIQVWYDSMIRDDVIPALSALYTWSTEKIRKLVCPGEKCIPGLSSHHPPSCLYLPLPSPSFCSRKRGTLSPEHLDILLLFQFFSFCWICNSLTLLLRPYR